MSDNAQDRAQIIQMGNVSNSPGSNGQVWFDGSHLWINIGGTNCRIDHPSTSAWTISGVTANRTYNAGAVTLLTIAQSVGTLMTDLQNSGYIS